MDAGRWVLLVAVVGALAFGAWRAFSDGRFRGTHRVPGLDSARPTTDSARPTTDSARPMTSPAPAPPAGSSVLAGTAYDAQLGERATLLQLSSAFCAPCRATRRVLTDVAAMVPGVVHLELDAEHHLELVRRLGVTRTPTTLVLDARGTELSRASGAPRPAQVLAALGEGIG